jgi:hypothetical protein
MSVIVTTVICSWSFNSYVGSGTIPTERCPNRMNSNNNQQQACQGLRPSGGPYYSILPPSCFPGVVMTALACEEEVEMSNDKRR